ncbi:MAG: hypothetical protein MUE97_07650 [Phycisphaerales bacterium]|jgi:hypothetical protein|nr:hypothetical protein [Phycisphaerales bacterium]
MAIALLINTAAAWAAWPLLARPRTPTIGAPLLPDAGGRPSTSTSSITGRNAPDGATPRLNLATRWTPTPAAAPADADRQTPPLTLLALMPAQSPTQPPSAWVTTIDGHTLRITQGQTVSSWTIDAITTSSLTLLAPDGRRVTLAIDARRPPSASGSAR